MSFQISKFSKIFKKFKIHSRIYCSNTNICVYYDMHSFYKYICKHDWLGFSPIFYDHKREPLSFPLFIFGVIRFRGVGLWAEPDFAVNIYIFFHFPSWIITLQSATPSRMLQTRSSTWSRHCSWVKSLVSLKQIQIKKRTLAFCEVFFLVLFSLRISFYFLLFWFLSWKSFHS